MSARTDLTRRKFLALTAAATAAQAAAPNFVFGVPTPPIPAGPGIESLAGQWRFRMDRSNVGATEKWFASDLEADHITLPGILQTQGHGDDITATTVFIAALPRDMAWYKLPQYAAYLKPGHVEVPYLSQPVKHYLGVAWYQRDIVIPANWSKKRVGLTLERARWQTNCYVDDKEIGTCRSLVAPHDYDLGILTPGKHRLSIRIDNSMLKPDYRFDGHSVSDAEGSTWNGIVGRIELAATSPVWIEDAQVFPSVTNKSAHIKVHIGNISGAAGSGTLSVGTHTAPVTWDASGGDATIDVPTPQRNPMVGVHPNPPAPHPKAHRHRRRRPPHHHLRPARDQVRGQAHPPQRRALQLPRHPRRRRLPAHRLSRNGCRHMEAHPRHLQGLGPQRNALPLLVPARSRLHRRRRARLLLPARVRHVELLRQRRQDARRPKRRDCPPAQGLRQPPLAHLPQRHQRARRQLPHPTSRMGQEVGRDRLPPPLR